jgi:hypothetical protein
MHARARDGKLSCPVWFTLLPYAVYPDHQVATAYVADGQAARVSQRFGHDLSLVEAAYAGRSLVQAFSPMLSRVVRYHAGLISSYCTSGLGCHVPRGGA